MAALVWLYCCTHCGPSWLGPFCLPAFFNLRGSSRSHTIPGQRRDTLGGAASLPSLQPMRGQTLGVCVCLCVPTKKSHGSSLRVPGPCAQPTIPSRPDRTASLCVFALQTPTSHQDLPALWERDKETAKMKERKAHGLQRCGFLWLKTGRSFASASCLVPSHGPSWINTQYISLHHMDLPAPSFISPFISKRQCLVCLIPSAEHIEILNSGVQLQIQSFALWLMIVWDKYNVK